MGKESEKKTTTKVDLPAYIENASKKLVGDATKLSDKPFEAYTGELTAGLNADQQTAFQGLRDVVANAPDLLKSTLQQIANYGAAPAQNVSTERVVDEGGRLGAIKDYMNPNIEAALMPALRKIQEQADTQRKQIGAQATSSGAFGDARQGILEAMLGRNTSTAMGDTAGKFYADAYDKAMASRTADLNRFLNADTTQAGYNETALNRSLTGATAAESQATADQNRLLANLQALLAGGTVQQQTQQTADTAKYNEFLRGQNWDFNTINALASALKGTPHETTQTQTQTQPDNSLLGLFGAIAPYALAPFTGGTSLAVAPLSATGKI